MPRTKYRSAGREDNLNDWCVLENISFASVVFSGEHERCAVAVPCTCAPCVYPGNCT